jgi:Na+/phosphate symporter
MKKVRMLLILGIWLAVLPYLGFPYAWKDVLTTLSGVGLIFMSLTLYKESKAVKPKETSEKTFDNFSENNFEEEKVRPESDSDTGSEKEN